MAVPTGLRMVSLRGLNGAIKDAMQNNLGQLPESVQFLAGLQRIQYVLVYPEQNDIVLAGPGEGWKVKEDGSIEFNSPLRVEGMYKSGCRYIGFGAESASPTAQT